MKYQIDSIDGHFMICGNEKLNHQDTEMLSGDLFIREAGQPDCFGLLFTDLEKREALTQRHRENAIKHAHLIAAAPEMLEALKKVELLAIDLVKYTEIDRAIAKDLNEIIDPVIYKAEKHSYIQKPKPKE